MAVIVDLHNPSLKNPTMTRYDISGLFLLPQALPIRTSAPIARDNDIRVPKLSGGEGVRTNMTAIIILAITAMGWDHSITRRLLRIILAPNQFERTTRHHHEGAPAVVCQNSPQGGLFCSRRRASSNRRMVATMATTMKMTVAGEGGETEMTEMEAK
jgi:hypothetical protein